MRIWPNRPAFPLLAMMAALSAATARADEFRAYWVDYANAGIRTQSEVTTLVADARSAHMNVIIAQVRPRGDAYYISGYEPRSEYLPAGSAADPLRLLLNAAHSGSPRLEVHAWVNCEKEWSKTSSPVSPYHPLRLFPEFVNRDDTDSTQSDEGNFFDPGNARQLDYNTKVIEDLARRYPDLDGIHYDFVRYPTLNWGFSPTALLRYSAQTGVVPQKTGGQWTTPASDWSTGLDPTFAQWRRDQVTGFVRETYARVYRVNPNIKISAALICITGAPSSATDSAWYTVDPPKYRYQDWFAWMKEGLIDEAVGMDYKKAGDASFLGWASFLADADDGRNSWGIAGQGNYLNTVPDSIQQLKDARSVGAAGHATYAYASPATSGGRARWAAALTTDNADNGYAAPFPTEVPPLSTPWKTSLGMICGRVVDSLTGAPPIPATNPAGPSTYPNLAGISLRIQSGPAGTSGRVVTPNGMGTYAFVDLPPGAYTVATVAPYGWPYAPASGAVTVTPGEATTLDLSIAPTAASEAIEVDDSDGTAAQNPSGSFYTESGAWAQGTSPTLGYQGTYRATAPTTSTTPAFAAWTPFVPVAGRYRIYARWAAGTNRGASVVYSADSGTERVDFAPVDQTAGGGQWNLLGSAYFHAGRAGRILVTANAGGYVIADAVRLERETPEFWPITTYTVPRHPLSAPASDGSAAFFGSTDGHLYAYSLAEDRPMWRFPTSETGLSASVSRPAMCNGLVVFGASDGRVRAVRSVPVTPGRDFPEQPQIVWTSAAITGGVQGSPSALDGVVYVGGGDGSVYGLNGTASTVDGVAPGGVFYRSPALGARVVSTPAVLPAAGVWVELENGQVLRLSRDLTTVRWASPGGTGTDASVYTDGRGVFASSGGGDLLAINAANGQPLWESPVHLGAAAATPMGDGAGRLFVVTADNRLWGVATDDGSPLPGYEDGLALPDETGPGAPLIVGNGTDTPDVYVPAVSRLTAVRGTAIRQHDLSRALGSHGQGRVQAPALCGDYVVATSDNGQLLGWKVK